MRPWLCALFLMAACWCYGQAQTFQYSHGWTNGRKRGGPASAAAAPAAALDDGPEPPCHVRRLRLMLQGRPVSELYLPCDAWQQMEEDEVPSGAVGRGQRGGGGSMAHLRHLLPPQAEEDM